MMCRRLTLLLLLGTIVIAIGSASVAFNTDAYALTNRCLWLPCNVTDYPFTILGYSLDCCTLPMPLNYAQPNRFISISMSRLRPLGLTTENNTLFLLPGGPGESSWGLLENVAQFIPATFGITLILPDHRGTGLSTVLGCDDHDSQNVTSECIAYLTSKWGVEGLNQFSITAAAHDLSIQIQSYVLDYPGRISIYGVSYGTLWLDRFLQIYPTLVQSAIMDGVINPFLNSVSRSDASTSSVSLQFLTYCQVQPECSGHFPAGQPLPIMLYNILTELDSNKQKCVNTYFNQYQLTSDKFRGLLFSIMQSGELYMDRTVIPAVVFRLNRCNEEDVTILKFFFNTTLGTASREVNNGPGLIYSRVLNFNIVQSERWLASNESEVDIQTIIAWHKATFMSSELPEQHLALRYQWPKYPLDQYHDHVASYSPLLMISGQLDPATTLNQVAQLASITSKTRTFYAIPLVGHVTVNVAVLGYYCPLRLICSWAFPNVFPVEWSDTKCIRDLPTTIDFAGTTTLGQQYSMKFLNVTRPFGNNSYDAIPTSANRPVVSFGYYFWMTIEQMSGFLYKLLV